MEIQSQSIMSFSVGLKLTEEEARAFLAITVYGEKAFLEVFYKSLGSTYLKPHEKGFKDLFKKVSVELPKHLKKFDETRKAFNGK